MKNVFTRSLALKLLSALLAVGAMFLVVLTLHVSTVFTRTISSEFEDKGQAIALALADAMSGGDTPGGGGLQAYLDNARMLSGVSYIYIQDPQGRVVAYAGPGTRPPVLRRLGWARDQDVRGGARVQVRGDVDVEVGGRRLQAIDVGVFMTGPGPRRGQVHVGMDRRAVAQQVAALRAGLLLSASSLGLVGTALGLWALFLLVLRPIGELTRVIEGFVENGDLSAEIKIRSDDELGGLARRCRQMMERLRVLPLQLRGSVSTLAAVREQLGGSVPVGLREVAERVEAAEGALGQVAEGQGGLSSQITQAQRSTRALSDIFEEGTAGYDQVAGAVRSLLAAVDGVSAAIDEMGRSVQGVAESIQEVHQSTSWISQFVGDMDRSMQKVQQSAGATTRISTQVAQDANTCLSAMEKTISGIERIRESARMTVEVIRSLGTRIGQIGNTVGLIEGIAQQTNFLALNATIIAAQAGDQGLGFGVVASEIKGLAERVGVATREIGDLMGRIAGESHNAVRAVERGLLDVEEGVRLGRETESALRQIVHSAHQAGDNVSAIAAATAEQTQGSASINATIHLIATKMQEVREHAAHQAKNAERVMRSAHEMKHLAQVVQDASGANVQRADGVRGALRGMGAALDGLAQGQRDLVLAVAHAQQAMRAIRFISQQQVGLLGEFERALGLLRQESETLGRYRL